MGELRSGTHARLVVKYIASYTGFPRPRFFCSSGKETESSEKSWGGEVWIKGSYKGLVMNIRSTHWIKVLD